MQLGCAARRGGHAVGRFPADPFEPVCTAEEEAAAVDARATFESLR